MTAHEQRRSEVLARLTPLLDQLENVEVLTEADDKYSHHSAPFGTLRDLHPAVVLVPSTSASLAKIVRFLYQSVLDFTVRGGGYRSASSRDVMVSMLGFKTFEYDSERKLATIGTGFKWTEVASLMRDVAPEYSVTVARTPSVGVGGSVLTGGYSWLSSEYGCIADPVNFIDAEVVKYDGTVVMASTEPDLMWALRGSGGGFGFMTKVILRAHPYPTNIWSGMILVPRDNLQHIARAAAEWSAKPQHPKVNLLMFVVKEQLLPTILDENQLQATKGDMLALHAYDACGEAHGRETFAWALNSPGAVDKTYVVDIEGMLDMQQNLDRMRGTFKELFAVPLAVPELDEEAIMRAVNWHETVGDIDKDIQEKTMMLIQFHAPPIGGSSEMAWPRRPDHRHYILALTGCPTNGTAEQQAKAEKIMRDVPEVVLGKSREYSILPAGFDARFHSVEKTYGDHSDKLVQLRKRYDPKLRFESFINPE